MQIDDVNFEDFLVDVFGLSREAAHDAVTRSEEIREAARGIIPEDPHRADLPRSSQPPGQ